LAAAALAAGLEAEAEAAGAVCAWAQEWAARQLAASTSVFNFIVILECVVTGRAGKTANDATPARGSRATLAAGRGDSGEGAMQGRCLPTA
jgi:hypothetical protein